MLHDACPEFNEKAVTFDGRVCRMLSIGNAYLLGDPEGECVKLSSLVELCGYGGV